MDIYTIVGLTGVAAYVAAYSALQLGMLDGNGARYSVANVIAASLVLVSLYEDFNLASAVTQVIWITVGLVGLGMRFLRGRASIVAEPGPTSETLNLRADSPTGVGRATLGLQADQAPTLPAS